MSLTTRERVNVHDLATRIAPHLSAAPGLVWRVDHAEQDSHGARISLTAGRNAGAALWLSIDWKGRVEIGGTFPMLESGRMYSAPNKESYGRISFDPTRDAKTLARDIERRCLSVYLPAYERAVAYAKEDAASRKAASDAARRIAAASGVEPHKQGGDGTVAVFPSTPGCYRVIVHPSTEEAPWIGMELERITPEQALAVLGVLRGAS